jgi:hypothetical protein
MAPVTDADEQAAPTDDKSKSPLTVRHDDNTVQVPTTSPPQASTLEQELPPLPVLPPELLPELPPEPPPELLLQPLAAIVEASSTALTSPIRPFRMRPL